MSNFSQYFPIGGSSSGDGGGGINSYAPFKVTATDNPVGYNATTGLYTNPVDESVFLKTGNTLVTVGTENTTYPNATFSTAINELTSEAYGLNFSPAFGGSRGWVMHPNGTDVYQANWRDNSIYKFNKSDGTGFTIAVTTATLLPAATNTPALGRIYPSPNGSELVVYIVADVGSGNAWGVMKVNATSLAITQAYSQTSIVIPPTQGGGGQLTGDPYYWVARTGTSTIIEEWDFGLTIPNATGTTLTITNGPSDIDSVGSDGTNLWVFLDGSSRIWAEVDSSGVATGKSFTPASDNDTFMFYDTVDSGFRTLSGAVSPNSMVYQQQTTIGDSTVRTSAMGDGQPLFIKLK